MIVKLEQLIKSLQLFGQGCEVCVLHEGEVIEIKTVSGASDGAVVLMTDRAANPDDDSEEDSEDDLSDEVVEALDQCERIFALCEDAPEWAEQFAMDVSEKVESVREWIEQNKHVTQKQLKALDGWENGISKCVG